MPQKYGLIFSLPNIYVFFFQNSKKNVGVGNNLHADWGWKNKISTTDYICKSSFACSIILTFNNEYIEWD